MLMNTYILRFPPWPFWGHSGVFAHISVLKVRQYKSHKRRASDPRASRVTPSQKSAQTQSYQRMANATWTSKWHLQDHHLALRTRGYFKDRNAEFNRRKGLLHRFSSKKYGFIHLLISDYRSFGGLYLRLK